MGLRQTRDAPRTLVEGFDAIRRELDLPKGFAPDVEAAAAKAAQAPSPADRADRRGVAFVTVDPPGSTDLDQALHIAADGDGFVLHYAIADVGAFVSRGGPVEAEAWARGETIYLPDRRTLLYPSVLTEGAASLLPDVDRPCVLFTIAVSADGELGDATVEQAVIRSRAQLTYADVDATTVPRMKELGDALAAAGERRGATKVHLPDEVVEADPSVPPGFHIVARDRLPSEDANEQISLAANMVAARMMMEAATGMFRVMAPPDPARLAGLRAAAIALGFTVPDDTGFPAIERARGPAEAVANLHRAARAGAGAGYRVFDPDEPPFHAAVAAPYAHATAPMRRLGDRYVLDLLVDLSRGAGEARPTAWADLARTMDAADSRGARADSAAVDLVEAFLMAPRVGETFDAVVTETRDDGVRLQLVDPPVRAAMKLDPLPPAGTRLRIRLTEADAAARRVAFAPSSASNANTAFRVERL